MREVVSPSGLRVAEGLDCDGNPFAVRPSDVAGVSYEKSDVTVVRLRNGPPIRVPLPYSTVKRVVFGPIDEEDGA